MIDTKMKVTVAADPSLYQHYHVSTRDYHIHAQKDNQQNSRL